MKPDDDLDAFIRAATPPPHLPPERVAAVVAATLARVPPRSPRRDAGSAWWSGLVLRYAVPMATAAMLGLIVGRQILPAGDRAPQIAYFVSSSTVLAGF